MQIENPDEMLGTAFRQLLQGQGTILLEWNANEHIYTAAINRDGPKHHEADCPLLLVQSLLGTLRKKRCLECGEHKLLTAFTRAGESEETRLPLLGLRAGERQAPAREKASGGAGGSGGGLTVLDTLMQTRAAVRRLCAVAGKLASAADPTRLTLLAQLDQAQASALASLESALGQCRPHGSARRVGRPGRPDSYRYAPEAALQRLQLHRARHGEQVYGIKELAAVLGVSYARIRQMDRSGQLPAVQGFGPRGQHVWGAADVETWLRGLAGAKV